MASIINFGQLTAKGFNFGQVSSLNKTFGNFTFDGHYYPQINMIAAATLVATPTFIRSIILYETINATEGKLEKIGPSEIAFLFGDKPVAFSKQIILSASLSAKLATANSFDATIVRQLNIRSQIRSNKNNQ